MQAAVDLLGLAYERAGSQVTSFELMTRMNVDLAVRFSVESDECLEAAIESRDSRVIEEANMWFNDHWDNIDASVDHETLNLYEPHWKRFRSKRPPKPSFFQMLAESGGKIGSKPVWLAVFHELDDDQAPYEQAWEQIKHHYSASEIAKNSYDGGENNPFAILKSGDRLKAKQGEYLISLWNSNNKSRPSGDGFVYRVKDLDEIRIKDQREQVLLGDQMEYVEGFKVLIPDYKKFNRVVREWVSSQDGLRPRPDRNLILQLKLSDPKVIGLLRRLKDAFPRVSETRKAQ